MAKTSIPKAVRKHHGCCCVAKVSEGGCSVTLPRGKEPLRCISGTEYQRKHTDAGRLCDLMVWWVRSSELFAIAMELKGGNAQVSHLVDQLQGGANLIDTLSEGSGVAFIPMLVHKQINTMQMRALSRTQVHFRGRKFKVKLVRCGASIESIVN